MIKVLIVDDYPPMRKAIRNELSGSKNIEVVGECEDGDEVLDFLSEQKVDVIIMDINMKRMEGFEATELAKEKYPEEKVIAHSSHDSIGMQKAMIRSGASAYIVKGTSDEDMTRTIERVYKTSEKK